MQVGHGLHQLEHPAFHVRCFQCQFPSPHVQQRLSRNELKDAKGHRAASNLSLSRLNQSRHTRVVDFFDQRQFFQNSIAIQLVGLYGGWVEHLQEAQFARVVQDTVRLSVSAVLDGKQNTVLVKNDFSFGKLHAGQIVGFHHLPRQFRTIHEGIDGIAVTFEQVK